MHVHADYLVSMRTTVEIDDKQRAELLRIAAERGLKGFSDIVREALSEYLSEDTSRTARINAALGRRNSLSAKEAEDLASRAQAIREQWR